MKSMRRTTTRSLAAIVAVLALMAGLTASAQAVTITSANPTSNLAKSDTVTVKLSFSVGEAFYAVAQCNDDLADGRACNSASAIGPLDVTKYPAAGHGIAVNSSFTNASLIPGLPPLGTSTTCKGVGSDNCAVFVSTYDSNGNHVGGAQVGITFK